MAQSLPENSRAQVIGEVVKLVLVVAAILLLFVFLYRLYAKATGDEGEKACHNAIVLQQVLVDKTKIGPFTPAQYVKPWPSVCRTNDKIIKTDDPKKAKKELAELMWQCWWMMGEGVIKPFDKDWWSGSRKCFVCYTVQFPELEESVGKDELMFYMRKEEKEGKSYYDLFKYGDEKLISSPVTDPVMKGGVYAIIYSSPTDPSFGAMATCLAMSGASTAIIGPVSAIGLAICEGKITLELIEAAKSDVVYASDTRRGNLGCYGSWYSGGPEVEATS